jgi:hypothetical protein
MRACAGPGRFSNDRASTSLRTVPTTANPASNAAIAIDRPRPELTPVINQSSVTCRSAFPYSNAKILEFSLTYVNFQTI